MNYQSNDRRCSRLWATGLDYFGALEICIRHTEAVISSTGGNSQQYIVWVKIIHFYYMPKIIRILKSCSMKIFCTVNISKLNFWLVICIAENFIWTTLKMIFSIFRFVCTLRFQIYKYCPNHTSMEIWFIQLSGDAWISLSKNVHLRLFLCSRVTCVTAAWQNICPACTFV